jgi:hypothetical protein
MELVTSVPHVAPPDGLIVDHPVDDFCSAPGLRGARLD